MLFGIEFWGLWEKSCPILSLCPCGGEVAFYRLMFWFSFSTFKELSTIFPSLLSLKAWSVPNWQQNICTPSTCQKRITLNACCPVPIKNQSWEIVFTEGCLKDIYSPFVLLNFILDLAKPFESHILKPHGYVIAKWVIICGHVPHPELGAFHIWVMIFQIIMWRRG